MIREKFATRPMPKSRENNDGEDEGEKGEKERGNLRGAIKLNDTGSDGSYVVIALLIALVINQP